MTNEAYLAVRAARVGLGLDPTPNGDLSPTRQMPYAEIRRIAAALLRYERGMVHREIAEILRRERSSVTVQLHRHEDYYANEPPYRAAYERARAHYLQAPHGLRR